ncbi:MAG TPA: ABC transporter permease [bacterium]|nr:ABC transporter permease [bacterium]
MTRYVGRRLVETVPVVFGVLLVVFVIAHLTPGDPVLIALGEHATPEAVEQLRAELQLDDPLPVAFLKYLSRVLRGDLGRSIQNNERVTVELATRFPATIELSLAAMLIASVVGILTGVVAAVRQNSWFDGLSMFAALFGFSMPIFWLGIMLILLFAWLLGWFPISGRLDYTVEIVRITNLHILDAVVTHNWTALGNALRHLVLPAITLSTVPLAIIARMTRSSLLEVLRQDYVRTARAKGLRDSRVVTRHALTNAFIPVITVIGLNVGSLLSGAILTETIFAWPGVGRLVVDGIFARDYPIVQGTVFVIALVFVAVNLLVDVSYAYLDPRIRYG